jgi:small-conductance mechanosensitive channel
MNKYIWRRANPRLIPSAAMMVVGIVLSTLHGNFRNGTLDKKLLAVVGILIFIVFAVIFLHVLTTAIRRVTSNHLGVGRAATVQFALRTIGYGAIILTTMDLLAIPVGRLLLGGAVLGIILGVAAQQALGNFFASIVLIISRPFSVGQHITITSGALGGQYAGKIVDIGLTHTKIRQEDGSSILLPNATLLSNAAIRSGAVTPNPHP